MKHKYIIGNWKMYLSYKQTIALYAKLSSWMINKNNHIIICPSSTSLAKLSESNNKTILRGGQNLAEIETGARTGQISVLCLKQLGCKYVIVGHSEVRQYLGDTDEGVNLKVKLALKNKITPIICVGENLSQRQAGQAEVVVEKQVKTILRDIKIIKNKQIIIAYEPIWAIGTGMPIKPQDAVNMHQKIKQILKDLSVDMIVPVIYGGSVNADNILEFLENDQINGALIGGASVDGAEFKKILKLTASLDQ